MNTTPQKTTKHRIYRHLRRTIISGLYGSGERLSVDAIASEFGTSVSPVRDALQMLGQEGLVTIQARSGYFVTRMTLKQLNDLLDMREILEMAGIGKATRDITPRQLQRLEEVHDGYTGDDADSYERYTDENRRFHVLLAEASGNDVLAEMVGHMLDRLARFMVLRRGGRIQIDSHQRLIEALRRKDEAAARRALLDEIRRSRERILNRVMSEEAERWTVK
jgi:DNA-binding GntR family transcriptional regulator